MEIKKLVSKKQKLGHIKVNLKITKEMEKDNFFGEIRFQDEGAQI